MHRGQAQRGENSLSFQSYNRPLEPEEVDFLGTWLRGQTLRNVMPTLDWLEDRFERLNRGRSARREPNLSYAEFLSLFTTRLGPQAPNASPDWDTWQQVMAGLRERERARRAEEREARLQARQTGETPAPTPVPAEEPQPAEPPADRPTKEEMDLAYAKARAIHVERKALGKAEKDPTNEARFMAEDGKPSGWTAWWPRFSTFKKQQRRWHA